MLPLYRQLEAALHARLRADPNLPTDPDLADGPALAEAVRSRRVNAYIHGRMAEVCAPLAETPVLPISESSVRRLLLGESSLDRANANTLDAVARFVGYADFAAYTRDGARRAGCARATRRAQRHATG